MKNGGNHNLPPRESRHQAISKPRPQTSGATTVNFYRHIKSSDNNDTTSIKSGVVSVSVERNIHKQNMGHQYNHHQSKSQSRSLQGQAVQGGILENYQIGKPIGQGAYAVVYVCYHKINMRKYAIKIYQKAKLNDSMKRKAV